MTKTVLAINPGSTSTKFAVFQDDRQLFSETVRHEDQDLIKFKSIADQLPYRLELLIESINKQQFNLETLDAVVGRGGLVKPLSSGTYEVNEEMLKDAKLAKNGEHASNLGSMMAYEIANQYDLPAYIVDPTAVDEMIEESRLSGIADLDRISHVHALNIKAVSRKIASQLGQPLEHLNFVVAHLGGGISVVAHRNGRIIDVNNANNEGPFSPERAGGLPALQLVKLCYSGKYTEEEMVRKLIKEGGIYSYLGTRSMIDVENLVINGDQKATVVLKAMIQQIGKEIGAMATVLEGNIDGIILTGGICHSEFIVEKIKTKVGFLGNVYTVPGEEELEALAAGTIRVLNGEEKSKQY